ncbi:hypothetical protein H310_11040 [Aphanomyces invadans]|uniref:Uncharacterized protein n=1 Tax=Aphanomyces invadans TaxID=157072 RepID=A0A024TNM3_9STRA|nr:hypothetical protein H310_11040 [Aphanomyces invadans]ETV95609.1 hypothetical protein H310_11040 [Aphanomyces invadans]|eukprot:XP_008875802.1 hypothetical protein H310_11040 [Aphanomyces invadans]
MLGTAWSAQTNDAHFVLDDKELHDVSQKVQSHKSFRKDYLAYCKVLNVTPHPKLCPRLDEEDKDLLVQGYDESDVDTVSVRNWMVDTASLKVMSLALHNSTAIHTVKLFNVALSVDQLSLVCEKFPATSIKTLQIEWNSIAPTLLVASPDSPDLTTCYAKLLSPQSSLTSLSLRANGITSIGGAAIAEALKTNTKLAVLNLFRNDLADDGAAALAYALPDNKTLMHLSVANNNISATGAMSLIRAITRYVLREDQLQHAADVEVQIQAALDAAKKQKKKLERADVIKELNLPDTETIDGVMYGVGNATLQSLTISGNNLTSYDDLQPLNKLLEDHHAKLKTHLHVVKAQRMFPRNASSPKPLSEFLLL